jgi:hypothetical protein
VTQDKAYLGNDFSKFARRAFDNGSGTRMPIGGQEVVTLVDGTLKTVGRDKRILYYTERAIKKQTRSATDWIPVIDRMRGQWVR